MRSTAGIVVMLLLASCNGSAPDATPADEQSVASPAAYETAVSRSDRREADRTRDDGRRPAEVLAFFGIEPGMRVLDMFSGGGYYSELLSYVVGPDGAVSAHNNAAYRGFVGDELTERYADGRLSNVSQLDAENNELTLPDGQFDAVTLVLAYHDIYYVDAENGWPEIDGPALLAEFFRGLKPGGIVGLVDHAAPTGAPPTTGGTTHRIDSAIVIAEMEAAGFVLDDESDLLRNPNDDLEMNVFDPAVRGSTDRFLLRFRKPE